MHLIAECFCGIYFVQLLMYFVFKTVSKIRDLRNIPTVSRLREA
jgi:hypothetical protein